MEKQYKDSITTKGAGYMKTDSEIGSYECKEGSNSENNYASVNRSFPLADFPTDANSSKKTAGILPANIDSPAKTGNLSC